MFGRRAVWVISLVWPPPCNSDHQDYYMFRIGDSNLNLQFPGHIQAISMLCAVIRPDMFAGQQHFGSIDTSWWCLCPRASWKLWVVSTGNFAVEKGWKPTMVPPTLKVLYRWTWAITLPWKLTVRPWKWMVGIRSFPIGIRPIFRCVCC